MLPLKKTYDAHALRRTAREYPIIKHSGEFDGVIDFASVLADPNDPTILAPQFNSGDNLHPNDAGYKAMASAIDLSLFLPRK
jgi:lysophospholipase L1-like esterase